MSQTPPTIYHPRWYRPRISVYWWLRRRAYFTFILRQLSSLFIGWFILFTLFLIRGLSQGPAAYKEFVTWSQHTGILTLNLFSLFFIIFHAITWLNLAPQAMVVHWRGKRVPPRNILLGNYAALVLFSLIAGLIILSG